MSPSSPNSTSVISRRGQTILSMVAASLIGGSVGLQLWKADTGWFLATLIGLVTMLVTSGMFSMALHGSFLFEAMRASLQQEAARPNAESNETKQHLSQMETAIAVLRTQDRQRKTVPVVRPSIRAARRPECSCELTLCAPVTSAA